MTNGPSSNAPLPSKLPASVRSPLCQIANLRFPDLAVKDFDKESDIPEPDEAELLSISRRMIEEEASNARKWVARNPGWEKQLASELTEDERNGLVEAKKSLRRALSAKLHRDENGREVPLARARDKYWELKRAAAKDSATRSADLAGRYYEQLIPAAKRATQSIWPELWEPIEHETREKTEERALQALRDMHHLLHAFWLANNEHARDWYIHRAREYYQRRFVLPKTSAARKERDAAYEEAKSICQMTPGVEEERLRALEKLVNAFSWVNIESEQLLNEPPAQRGFEDALFKLQGRAKYASKAPGICKNDECTHPYFLKGKKSRNYCSPECFRKAKRKRDLEIWNENKDIYRPKVKTRRQQ